MGVSLADIYLIHAFHVGTNVQRAVLDNIVLPEYCTCNMI